MSDSGNLSIGGNAAIVGTMTVTGVTATSSMTASAFFGDGSHLAGVSGTAAGPITSTVSFTATNTSTFTVNAASASFTGPVMFNSGFSFGDGTQQTTAAVSVSTYATGGHSTGTIYQNTTGKPKFVTITVSANGGGASVFCDAQSTPTTVVVSNSGSSAAPDGIPAFFVVLPNFYYKVTVSGSSSVTRWTEWW